MTFATRPRGGRVVHTIAHTIASPISDNSYVEIDSSLPDEVDLADELVITSTADTSIFLATGPISSEANKLPVPLGDPTPAVVPYTNVFKAGDRLTFQRGQAVTLDGGVITLTFISKYK